MTLFSCFCIDKDSLTFESLIVQINSFIQLLSPTINSVVPEDITDNNLDTNQSEIHDQDKFIKLWARNNSVIDNEIIALSEKISKFIKK